MAKLTTSNWTTSFSYPYSSGIQFCTPPVETKRFLKDLSSFNNTDGGRYFILDLKDRYTYPDNFRTYSEACTFAEKEMIEDQCIDRFAICYIDAVAEGKQNGFTVDIRGDLE